MALIDTIERLREAPIHKRKIALAVSVTFLMALVIGIWILSLKGGGATQGGDAGAEKPFEILWNSVRENTKNALKSMYERRK